MARPRASGAGAQVNMTVGGPRDMLRHRAREARTGAAERYGANRRGQAHPEDTLQFEDSENFPDIIRDSRYRHCFSHSKVPQA